MSSHNMETLAALKDVPLYPRHSKEGPFVIEVPGSKSGDTESAVFRHIKAKDGLITTLDPNIRTLYDNLKYSVKTFGHKRAVGSRRVVQVHTETKKVKKVVDGVEQEVDKNWSYFELSPYSWLSYVEYEKLAKDLGSGLRSLGLDKACKIHLFAPTSLHWLAIANGAGTQSIPIVTAYDSLGEEGLRHSIKQTETSAIFLDPTLLPTLSKILHDLPSIKNVVYDTTNDVKEAGIEDFKSKFPEVKVLSFDELRELGRQAPVDDVPPSPEDLVCIMYTSGSTGPPKGVPLTHKNLIAASK
ncbi:long-chain fatty acid-CoA ligase [Ascosphaera atra]|nr:long-chain fatty acid-CoA ligase [Ascosphaera atra]